MLRPAIVAKGLTTRCQAKYERVIGHSAFIQHTPSGLTNTASFIDYLQSVILPHTRNQQAVLIVDAWGAHLTKPVREFCSLHRLHLVKVPETFLHDQASFHRANIVKAWFPTNKFE